MKKYQGSMVALISPFSNGKVDFAALEKMVEFQIQNGTTCLVVTGTTGALFASNIERLDNSSFSGLNVLDMDVKERNMVMGTNAGGCVQNGVMEE